MFLVARALDAISDPCMGLLADRTRSRWGKFRPWVLFRAHCHSGSSVYWPIARRSQYERKNDLCSNYLHPTYLTLYHRQYPYCALGGVITNDPTQRISLQSWRFVLATAGGMLSTVLMMPLVNLIGGDNKPLGFQGGIAVLSVVAFMMLAFCFFTTKERVEAPPTTTSMRDDLRDIWQNDQWRIVGLLTIFNILAVCVRGGAMMYYVTWILGTPEVFVAFLTTYCVGNLIGSALAKPLTDWKCKVTIFWWTNALLAVISLAMFFVPMQASITMFVFIFVIGVLHQLVTPIQWVMMSDTVDYGEWCNGKRLTGISLLARCLCSNWGWPSVVPLSAGCCVMADMMRQKKRRTAPQLASLSRYSRLFRRSVYLLSANIAKRYYSLTTHNLKTVMEQLAQANAVASNNSPLKKSRTKERQ
ncbi:glycoside-pentoside-hexuronide (GPH):cation symporter [Escherichia coli]